MDENLGTGPRQPAYRVVGSALRSWRVGFLLLWGLLAFLTPSRLPAAEDRNALILNDRASVQNSGLWIYNDFPQALAQSKATGKPILVALRCVP